MIWLDEGARLKLQELVISQPTFTCSKLTIEAVEQGVTYVKS